MPERTEALKKAQQKYMEKFSIARVRMERDRYECVQAHAAAQGESVNSFIGRAISETMARDSNGTAPEIAQNGPESTQGAGVVSLPSEAVRTAQDGTEMGKQPDPADRAKAWEKILETFSDVGTMDLDKARCEHLGIMYLPPDTLEAAQQAAERTGETVADFVRRAVDTQAQRDKSSLALGINPATGGKLEKEA